MYRSGQCSGSTNAWQCRNQPSCLASQYLQGALPTVEGVCLDQPTCKQGAEFLSGAADDKQGVCKACSNLECKTSSVQFRSGSCGNSNSDLDGYTCVDQPVCGNMQYLAGFSSTKEGICVDQPTCSGSQYLANPTITAAGKCTDHPTCAANEFLSDATGTTRGSCVGQPTCKVGEYLAGASVTQQGQCATCSNSLCPSNQYRVGACSGTNNKFECSTCKNIQCPSNYFRVGNCSGTSNAFFCELCDNRVCDTDQFQSGTCGGTTNGLDCEPCSNAKCASGTYRTGTCSGTTNAYTCVSRGSCPAGQYLEGGTGTAEGKCVDQPTCSTGDYLLVGSPTQKGTCAKQPTCTAGKYLADASSTSKGSCTPCTNLVCPDGQVRDGQCSSSVNKFTCSVCANIACEANAFRKGRCSGTTNGFSCELCTDGQYKDSATSCAPKKAASACGPTATFVPGTAAEKTRDDTQCRVCAGGEYKDDLDGSCKAKRGFCPPASYFKAGDDSVKELDDTSCLPCPSNTYQPADSSVARCRVQTTCSKDTFITADSKVKIRQCVPCSGSSFQAADGHRLEECSLATSTTATTVTIMPTTITTTTTTATTTTTTTTTSTAVTATITTTIVTATTKKLTTTAVISVLTTADKTTAGPNPITAPDTTSVKKTFAAPTTIAATKATTIPHSTAIVSTGHRTTDRAAISTAMTTDVPHSAVTKPLVSTEAVSEDTTTAATSVLSTASWATRIEAPSTVSVSMTAPNTDSGTQPLSAKKTVSTIAGSSNVSTTQTPVINMSTAKVIHSTSDVPLNTNTMVPLSITREGESVSKDSSKLSLVNFWLALDCSMLVATDVVGDIVNSLSTTGFATQSIVAVTIQCGSTAVKVVTADNQTATSIIARIRSEQGLAIATHGQTFKATLAPSSATLPGITRLATRTTTVQRKVGETESASKSDDSTGTTIGIVIGCVLAVLFIVAVVVFVYKRQKPVDDHHWAGTPRAVSPGYYNNNPRGGTITRDKLNRPVLNLGGVYDDSEYNKIGANDEFETAVHVVRNPTSSSSLAESPFQRLRNQSNAQADHQSFKMESLRRVNPLAQAANASKYLSVVSGGTIAEDDTQETTFDSPSAIAGVNYTQSRRGSNVSITGVNYRRASNPDAVINPAQLAQLQQIAAEGRRSSNAGAGAEADTTDLVRLQQRAANRRLSNPDAGINPAQLAQLQQIAAQSRRPSKANDSDWGGGGQQQEATYETQQARQADYAEGGMPQYVGAEPDYGTADSTYATAQQGVSSPTYATCEVQVGADYRDPSSMGLQRSSVYAGDASNDPLFAFEKEAVVPGIGTAPALAARKSRAFSTVPSVAV